MKTPAPVKTKPASAFDGWLLSAYSITAAVSLVLQVFLGWLLTASYLFGFVRSKNRPAIPFNPFIAATLLFLATFLIGAVAGVDPGRSCQTLYKYLAMLLVFPVGAAALSIKKINDLVFLYVDGAAFCSACGIAKHLFWREDRINSFSGDYMVFGGLLMSALILSVFLLKTSPLNVRLWVGSGLILTGLILTQTRGAWLGGFTGLFLLFLRLDRKWLLAGFALMVGVYFLLPQKLQERVTSIVRFKTGTPKTGLPELPPGYSAGQLARFTEDFYARSNSNPPVPSQAPKLLNLPTERNSPSYPPEIGVFITNVLNSPQDRFLIWGAGLRIVRDYPWGIGEGNLSSVYPNYRSPLMFFELTVPHLHNNFLQICAQNGWVGFAAYLLWIGAYYWMALRFKAENEMEGRFNWAFLCVFSAVLVWGWTEYTFSHMFMNAQFFLIGLQVFLWTRSSPQPPPLQASPRFY